jgi:hypothetical protein
MNRYRLPFDNQFGTFLSDLALDGDPLASEGMAF